MAKSQYGQSVLASTRGVAVGDVENYYNIPVITCIFFSFSLSPFLFYSFSLSRPLLFRSKLSTFLASDFMCCGNCKTVGAASVFRGELGDGIPAESQSSDS